ncbi:uncharacterized protein LOC142222142 isoform X2 [Haematobia irritans]|uniref:uncharacterized protein LOC142222142 isoform X2 n=1 Tax=Haematobia irritans TaxID=7368 RepID=UPI003F4FA2A1
MQNFKYKPLKHNDEDDVDEDDNLFESQNNAAGHEDQIRFHWSFKLLIVIFLITQVIYISYDSDYQLIEKNSNGTKLLKICDNGTCLNSTSPEESAEENYDMYLSEAPDMEANEIYDISHETSEIGNPYTVNPINNNFISSSTINQYSTTNRDLIATIKSLKKFSEDPSSSSSSTSPRTSSTASMTTSTTASDSAIVSITSVNNSNRTIASGTNLSTINHDDSMKGNDSTMSITLLSNASTSSSPLTSIANNHISGTQNPPLSLTGPSNATKPKYKEGVQRQFYINTSRCHIPYVNPFTPEARKMFKPSHSTGCTKDKAIISMRFDDLNREYVLHINYTVAMTFIKNATKETIMDDLHCCYRQIERAGSGGSADNKFHLLPCTNFHQDFIVPTHIKGIIVDCTSKLMGNKLIQQDAFTFIQVKRTNDAASNMKQNLTDTNSSKTKRKLGILLIGIDSLSRINFRRTMPETAKYMESRGWYELRGYNKVGDNTFPNLLPLLTGHTGKTVVNKCNPKFAGGLDKCTFVWDKLHKQGFVTAYAEDTPTIATFNYLKKGFQKVPTDYYYHPIALAIEKTMKVTKKSGLNYCVGRHQSGEYVYDFAVEFAKRFKNQSHFGLFWTNSFSHNAYYTTATMDTRMLAYLKDLEEEGTMESSVIFFFSDHGRRWGPLLKLAEGFLEERLPMFFISLPKWIKSEYPDLVNSLEVNQGRLVTPFDIYMTLLDLGYLVEPTLNVTSDGDCVKAQSILRMIPENRTCDDACIPETWCTCIPYITQSTKSDVVKNVTQLVLDEMNNYLAMKNISSICSKLTLNEITRATLRDVDVPAHSLPNIATYKIEFSTKPKTKPLSEFSATIDYDTQKKKIIVNVEDISRQSMYEKTAKCVNDKQAKKYCICKNSLKS